MPIRLAKATGAASGASLASPLVRNVAAAASTDTTRWMATTPSPFMTNAMGSPASTVSAATERTYTSDPTG